MIKEQLLKDYIISRFKSVLAFSQEAKIPYTTINNMLNRGIKNSSAVNAIELCKALGIEFEALYEGRITEKKSVLHDLHLSISEQSHIKKYRNLDGHGKKNVDFILESESERCVEEEKQKFTPQHSTAPHVRQLPLFEYPASAGVGAFVGGDEYELVDVPDAVPNSAMFGIKIKGNSMSPKIPDGAIVWVRQQPSVEDGEICIVVINDEGFCKVKQGDRFVSLNKDYPDKSCNAGDIVRISGKVVYIEKPE